MSPPTADYPPMNQSYPTPAGTGKPRTRRRGIGPAATMGLVLFGAFVVAGIVGAWAALATYASVSSGLPPTRPRSRRSSCPSSPSCTTGSHKVVLARFGEFNRAGRDVRRDPAGARRRDDGRRGRLVLGQRGLRHGGHRGRRHRLAARPSARRVDHHPAARPPAPADGQRRRGDRPLGDPEAARDHPVDPRHGGVPGSQGQAEDHGRLPQPELLRQRVVRRRRGRAGLLRCPARQAHARPGRDPRRPAQVAVHLRPGPERERRMPRSGRRDGHVRRVQEVAARRPGRRGDRPAAEPGPRPHGAGPDAADQGHAHGRRLRRPRATSP